RLQEISRRGQRVRRTVEISRAVVQDVLGQELGVTDLPVHGPTRACRERPAIDQGQSGVKLLGEISRPTAVIGESSRSRQKVLSPGRIADPRFHSPNGQERPRRDAVALLNGGKEGSLRLLERASARDDGRAAALGEKLIERQTEAPLAAV